jgi:hypothetical protein
MKKERRETSRHSKHRMSAPDEEPKRRKNPAAVALGRRGGLVGGKARAQKLTAEQRSDIARRAAEARWKNRPG